MPTRQSAMQTCRWPRLHALITTLALATTLLPGAARAGNDDGILVGGQAALTGGAITAITADGAAAWYNPAGLARIKRHAFDINGSAYGISLFRAKRLFTLPDGTTADASVTDWQLVPTALSYSRVLSRRVVGSFGVFIPTTSDVDLRAAIRESNGTQWTVGADNLRNEYDYIASVGVRVSETLRVGAALHGIYISTESMVQVAFGTPGSSQQPFRAISTHETVGDYAARIGLGVQWTPLPQLELGLSVQTPALTGIRKSNSDVLATALSTDNMGAFGSRQVNEVSSPWELSTPLLVRLGGALQLGRTQLLLDGTVTSPLDASDRTLDRRLSGNVRLGVLARLSETLTVGTGAFTDRNGLRSRGANFVGVAGGVRFSSHYLISDGQRPLTFGTTLAGRYAYGWGGMSGIPLSTELDARADSAQLRVHELAFNLGGSVTF